jgi:hypothetical protein
LGRQAGDVFARVAQRRQLTARASRRRILRVLSGSPAWPWIGSTT